VITTRPATNKAASAEMAKLTPREREVVILLAQGLSDTELAVQLSISEATVKTHIAHALTKLGCRNRAQLIVTAYQSGLTRPPLPNTAQ